MKKLIALLLALLLLFSLSAVAAAANDEAQAAADTLHDLGLFQGKGTNADGTPIYDLGAPPTRNEAVTMLVRLLGKEAEAKAANWSIPFTDVADWAKPYVGYAYANGLTKGTGDATFGGDSLITASQYLTFVLRALGYESGADFQWDKAWELSDRIGLTDGRYNAASGQFLRGDVAIISANALAAKLKGSNVMLLRKLYNQLNAEKWADTMKNLPVSGYGLPDAIGKTTLDYDSAFALIGKDPAIIAEAVKTVGDVVQYMIASVFAGHDPFTPWYGNGLWGFDPSGDEQLRQGYGTCCAGFANMGLYLLEGDYEEMGIIRWLGAGNHTISYLLLDGKYYVFDLTEVPVYYNDPGFQATVTVLDRLEDYYDQMPAIYPKAEVTNLIALTDTTVSYPWGGGGGTGKLIFPTEAKGHVIQIYARDASNTVTYKDVTIEVPWWNSDNLNLPATNIKYDVYEELETQFLLANRFYNEAVADRFGEGVRIFLLCPNGVHMPDNGCFGITPLDSETFTVLLNDEVTADYTVTSSDESICGISLGADGTFTTLPRQQGIITITVKYYGLTAKYYYAVGYTGYPPFEAYIAKENTA